MNLIFSKDGCLKRRGSSLLVEAFHTSKNLSKSNFLLMYSLHKKQNGLFLDHGFRLAIIQGGGENRGPH